MEKKKSGDKVAKAKDIIKKTHEKGSGFRKEFIEFINRGSVVDLAVGVAVGGAFTAIVNSLVHDIVMPIVGLIMGGINLTDAHWDLPNWTGAKEQPIIYYGNFIQNVLQFLIVAWVIFLLIKVMNKFHRKQDAKKEEIK